MERDPIIIGGEHIFGDALKYQPSTLHMTVVKIDAVGDVRFPIDGERLMRDEFRTFDGTLYKASDRSEWQIENDIHFQFVTFNRS